MDMAIWEKEEPIRDTQVSNWTGFDSSG